MIVELLQNIYTITGTVLTPVYAVWDFFFCREIDLCPMYKKIVIIDVLGGSGKTTLATEISHKYGHFLIKMDDCKFGENWKRYSPEEFRENVKAKLAVAGDKYVIDSLYSDDLQPAQKEVVDEFIKDADLVIWQDIPQLISIWRKLFRSYKRAIGVGVQGTAPETFRSVKAMIMKTWYKYNDRWQILNNAWKDDGKYTRRYFPNYLLFEKKQGKKTHIA